jgi:hypothetical protein
MVETQVGVVEATAAVVAAVELPALAEAAMAVQVQAAVGAKVMAV